MASILLESLFGKLSLSPLALKSSRRLITVAPQSALSQIATPLQHRSFSASTMLHAPKVMKKKKKGRKGRGEAPDPRIINLKKSMPRDVPAPLRFGRNRALRHWTIHRAWQLWQRKDREGRERELMRLQQSMSNACEELRKTAGPGLKSEGYLYRVAMEKKGVYGHNSIPIEYTRPQTETPPRKVWDHEWTRPAAEPGAPESK